MQMRQRKGKSNIIIIIIDHNLQLFWKPTEVTIEYAC